MKTANLRGVPEYAPYSLKTNPPFYLLWNSISPGNVFKVVR